MKCIAYFVVDKLRIREKFRGDMSRKCLLITPCRDEADYIQNTIDSVSSQSVLPTKWIIVDDGSTDNTPAVLSAARESHPFIEVIRREDRGQRAVGPGVVDAFYAGLEGANLSDYDYICKLDGDLILPPKYFALLMNRFEADPYLGSFSGKIYTLHEGRLINEKLGDENAVGAAKFFRTKCFQDIGGFVRQSGWDGIDGHMLRMKGWITGSEDNPEIRLTHLRLMGSTQKNLWTGRLRWGMGKYFMGSAPYYVLAVSVYRMLQKPYIIGGIGIFAGYFQAMLRGEARLDDKQYLRFFRSFELSSFLRGKRKTLERYNASIRKNFRPPDERPAQPNE